MGSETAWTQAAAEDAGSPWRLIERALAYTTFWGALGAVLPLSLYIAEVLPYLEPEQSWRWLVQIITFLLATTACSSAAIAAGVCLARRFQASVPTEVILAGICGALASSVFGAIGVDHFGRLRLPYVGGNLLLATSVCALIVVAAAYARAERPQPKWTSVIWAALLPLVLVAIGITLVVTVFPGFSLELDNMRVIAAEYGLPLLGAFVGAAVGASGGVWLSLTARLARP